MCWKDYEVFCEGCSKTHSCPGFPLMHIQEVPGMMHDKVQKFIKEWTSQLVPAIKAKTQLSRYLDKFKKLERKLAELPNKNKEGIQLQEELKKFIGVLESRINTLINFYHDIKINTATLKSKEKEFVELEEKKEIIRAAKLFGVEKNEFSLREVDLEIKLPELNEKLKEFKIDIAKQKALSENDKLKDASLNILEEVFEDWDGKKKDASEKIQILSLKYKENEAKFEQKERDREEDFDKRMNKINMQINQAEEEKKILENENEKLEKLKEELKEESKSQEEFLKHITENKNSRESECKDLEQIIKMQISEKKQLETTNCHLTSNISQNKNEIEKQKQNMSKNQKEIEKDEDDIEELRIIIQGKKEERQRTDASISEKKIELNQVEERKSKLDNEIKKLKEEKNRAIDERNKLSKEKNELSNQIGLFKAVLRDVVVYPHMVIPLFVGRDKSIQGARRRHVGQQASAAGCPAGPG